MMDSGGKHERDGTGSEVRRTKGGQNNRDIREKGEGGKSTRKGRREEGRKERREGGGRGKERRSERRRSRLRSRPTLSSMSWPS